MVFSVHDQIRTNWRGALSPAAVANTVSGVHQFRVPYQCSYASLAAPPLLSGSIPFFRQLMRDSHLCECRKLCENLSCIMQAPPVNLGE